MMEKINCHALIAMNAFKGSLSNIEACEAVSEALKQKRITSRILPVGDGGRGTLATIQAILGGEVVKRAAEGPLNESVEASILCHPNAKAPEFLYLESADTCGYHLVPGERRDAMRASSNGLGILLGSALAEWKTSVKRVYIGLGDTLISDVGMGMLNGLGWSFFDRGGKPLWGNADSLRFIHSFKAPVQPLGQGVKFIVLCDVLNPLCGRQGSAETFAPQKGASLQQVKLIAEGMENFAKVILPQSGWKVAGQPMTGSAGGLATAFLVFLNAELVHGARFVLDWIGFDKLLSENDFLITGEGRTDSQTLAGKAPNECLTRAEQMGKKSVVISGRLAAGYEALLTRPSILGCYACGEEPSAKAALKSKALEVFSDVKLLKSLSEA